VHINSTLILICLFFLFVLFLVIPRYGEVVDVNIVRDKGTGKSKGFAFLAYEDQTSTDIAIGSSLSPVILETNS